MSTTPFNPADIDSAVDETINEHSVPKYIAAQWHNGDAKLAKLGGVAAKGGIIIPFTRTMGKRKVANLPADFPTPVGFTRETITFDNGETEEVLAATVATLAIIRYRRCWFFRKDGKTTYFPWNQYAEGLNMRGKYQVLIAFSDMPDALIALTFSGTNSRQFDAMLSDVDTAVTELGAHLGTKKRLPRLAAFVTVTAGAASRPNEKYTSMTTAPMILPKSDVNFVGVENLQAFQAAYKAAQVWVDAYDKPNSEVAQSGNGLPAQAAAEAAPEPEEDSIPF